ncbi:MAG: MmgE/PrpD family protein [Parasporobacterium sp.]|nr:MmgE/PrpD family protein [Parasporobacterium sp.]
MAHKFFPDECKAIALTEIDETLYPPHGLERLCENAVQTDYSRLSERNIRIFKDRLLDMTGCIFGGAIVEEDKGFYEMLYQDGGKEEAPRFAYSGRMPLMNAVMHNCILSRANDFGSMSFELFDTRFASHCGETLIPMGLTLADVRHTGGKEFIANNIAAEDMTARLLYTLPIPMYIDMHLVSTAASVLASKYYNLDPKQMRYAVGFAVTNSTRPAHAYFDKSQEFMFHNGESARMGIMAAKLAQLGWKGPDDAYFADMGFVRNQMKEENTLPDLYLKCFDELGETYFTETSIKRFPGGLPSSAAHLIGMQLHKQIQEAYGTVDGEKIARVHVYRFTTRPESYAMEYTEPTHMNSLFCYRFAVVSGMLSGRTTAASVQTENIQKNPELFRLASEATLESYRDESGLPLMKAVVVMKDGSVFEAKANWASEMDYYPTHEEIREKFWDQFHAFGKLRDSVGEKIIELAGRIETLEDMREYTELLSL